MSESELMELLAKATPGEWRVGHDLTIGPDGYGVAVIVAANETAPEADAALIVAAVNALPGLLDELSTLRARVADVERERDSLAERLTDTWAENAESSDALVGVMAVATGNLAAMRGRAEKAEREARSQAERIRVLEAALEPFARAADRYDPEEGDDAEPAFVTRFAIGHLRRARAAMEPRNG